MLLRALIVATRVEFVGGEGFRVKERAGCSTLVLKKKVWVKGKGPGEETDGNGRLLATKRVKHANKALKRIYIFALLEAGGKKVERDAYTFGAGVAGRRWPSGGNLRNQRETRY